MTVVSKAALILIISSSYSALCISMVSDDMGNNLWQYVGIVHGKLRREEFALMQALASERRAHGHYVHAGCQPCLHPGGRIFDHQAELCHACAGRCLQSEAPQQRRCHLLTRQADYVLKSIANASFPWLLDSSYARCKGDQARV